MDHDQPNPFQVLGLPTGATSAEIVSRGRDLSDLAASEEQRRLCRWAVEQLLSTPQTRREYELFEMPGTLYRDPDWEHFVLTHRHYPVNLRAWLEKSPPPTLEDFNLAAVVALVLEGLLIAPEVDLTAAVALCPFAPDSGPPPLEVRHVIFG